MTRYLAVICLSLSSWTGGVIFREIDTEGLTWFLGASITVFALMSVAIGYRIAGGAHYLTSARVSRNQATPSTPCPVCQPGSDALGPENTASS